MSDPAQLLVDHLDVWTGAIARKSGSGRGSGSKIGLYGIDKLRGLILDLSVRGKLVAQDPADGGAGELLKCLVQSRPALIELGLIRKSAPIQKLGGKAPFVIPNNWVWVRLDQVGAIVGGGTPPATDPTNFAEPGDGIPWLTPADLGGYSDLYISRGARDLTDKGLAEGSAKLMPEGTVLFTSRAPIGYVAIASNPISTNQGFKSVVPFDPECSRYIALALRTFADEINANAPGTTFKEVSGKIVGAIPFPLPPLAEQKRIVAKVDELMALVDALEAGTRAGLEAHETLVRELLATLVNSQDADDLAQNWSRIETHFDSLFTTEESIGALKQTVLELAIRGLLVDQNEADEPAAMFLKSNRSSKSERSKVAGAFQVPQGWEWAQIQDVLDPKRDISYGVIKLGPEPTSGGVPTLRCSDVKPGRIDLAGVRKVSEEIEADYSRTRLRGREVLINIRGTLGGVAKVSDDLIGYNVAREVAVVPFAQEVSEDFFVYLMLSPYFWRHIQENLRGIAYKGLNLGILRTLPIPIPPLAEQLRIVEKIDRLFVISEMAVSTIAAAEVVKSNTAKILLESVLE